MNEKIGGVVFPGDLLPIKKSYDPKKKTRIGSGLTPTVIKDNDCTEEAILVTRPGVLHSSGQVPPKLWVQSLQRKYIPRGEDRVIGIITNRTAQYYYVDIHGPTLGLLGVLEFEGATKRNRPELQTGDVIFCRVLLATKDMEPQLTCKSIQFSKSWVTGESLYMQLTNGFIFDVSLNWAHKLNRMYCPQLGWLGKFIPFEIAVGLNGRIWIKAGNIRHTILLSNAIQNGEFMNLKNFQMMTHGLLRKFGLDINI